MNKLDVNSNLEEAAWAYYDKNKPLIPHELDLHKELISFFIGGAQWQKEQMIDKACEFLRSHIDKQLVIYHEFTWRSRDEFIEGFKKAMEK